MASFIKRTERLILKWFLGSCLWPFLYSKNFISIQLVPRYSSAQTVQILAGCLILNQACASQKGLHNTLLFVWRKRRDSNPRDISAHTISSRAPSTTRPRFHVLFYHTSRFIRDPPTHFTTATITIGLSRKKPSNRLISPHTPPIV